jgi:hypothetical protein
MVSAAMMGEMRRELPRPWHLRGPGFGIIDSDLGHTLPPECPLAAKRKTTRIQKSKLHPRGSLRHT